MYKKAKDMMTAKKNEVAQLIKDAPGKMIVGELETAAQFYADNNPNLSQVVVITNYVGEDGVNRASAYCTKGTMVNEGNDAIVQAFNIINPPVNKKGLN